MRVCVRGWGFLSHIQCMQTVQSSVFIPPLGSFFLTFRLLFISDLMILSLPSSSPALCPALHFPPGDWPTGWKWAHSRIQNPLKSLSVSFCFPAPSASFYNYSLLPAASLANSCPFTANVFSHLNYRTIIPLAKWSTVSNDIYSTIFASNWPLGGISIHCLSFPCCYCM